MQGFVRSAVGINKLMVKLWITYFDLKNMFCTLFVQFFTEIVGKRTILMSVRQKEYLIVRNKIFSASPDLEYVKIISEYSPIGDFPFFIIYFFMKLSALNFSCIFNRNKKILRDFVIQFFLTDPLVRKLAA